MILRRCRKVSPPRNHAYQSRIAGCVQNAWYASPGTIRSNSTRRNAARSAPSPAIPAAGSEPRRITPVPASVLK
ncbi:MAG TPA: hypothetical protein VGJ44_12540 [Kribbellaceae bacterium]